MYRARVRLPVELQYLLRNELESAIEQANLGDIDTDIAQQYLIQKIPQVDIACSLGIERSTISRRLPAILQRIAWAAGKMGMT